LPKLAAKINKHLNNRQFQNKSTILLHKREISAIIAVMRNSRLENSATAALSLLAKSDARAFATWACLSEQATKTFTPNGRNPLKRLIPKK
jgi:hypothetical protein